MGDKPARKGQRFCLHFAACLTTALLLWGCAGGRPSTAAPWQVSTPVRHLTLSECLLMKGDYDGARQQAQIVLERFAGEADDRALLLLGMARVHPDNPQRDVQGAGGAFRRIVKDYPLSPLVVDARNWLALIDRMADCAHTVSQMAAAVDELEKRLAQETERRRQLEKRLQQMKAVDLTID